jgi:hypothetical protein
MRLPGALLGLLIRGLRFRYGDMLRHTARYGAAATGSRWAAFQAAMTRMLRWSDLIAGAAIRWRGLHERTELPNSTAGVVAREQEAVAGMEEAATAGRAIPLLKAADTDPPLSYVTAESPWYRQHAAITDPLIVRRAEWVAQTESHYLAEKQASLAAIAKGEVAGTMPVFRLDRFLRDARGEVQAVSEQVQLAVPTISDAFPFAEYRTREDRHVRPTHAAMDGFVAHRSWPGWTVIRPRCGWNCRCNLRFFAEFEAIAKGWMTADGSRAGKPLFIVKWPSDEARQNYESGVFPDEDWKGPKAWSFPAAAA